MTIPTDEVAPPIDYEVRGLIRDIPLGPHDLVDARTPADRLFMLAHLGVVRMRPEDWRLDLGGLVERPLRLRLADLDGFSAACGEAVHQCAGNPLDPTVATRRVACVVWEGVRLSDLLAEARPKDGASHVWADGADAGSFPGEHVPRFRKDLPIERAAADVLLATRLNGAALPGRHGGPVRLVVPSFYGTNSVKWVWRLTLADRRADGLFTTRYYNDPQPDGSTRPVYALAPESVVVTLAPHASVGLRLRAELHGWAWGDAPVAAVEVSCDGGQTWTAAELAARIGREWQAWHMTARFAASGPAVVMCRAVGRARPDAAARECPQRDPPRRGRAVGMSRPLQIGRFESNARPRIVFVRKPGSGTSTPRSVMKARASLASRTSRASACASTLPFTMLQRFIWAVNGSNLKPFPGLLPDRSWAFGTFTLRFDSAATLAAGLAVVVGTHLVVTRTRLGLAIRAVAQDPEVARLAGIDFRAVVLGTFALGSMLAACAGLMLGLYYREINFGMGLLLGVVGFACAVVGGLESLLGPMIGGFLLAGIQTLVTVGLPGMSAYKDVVAFAVIIILVGLFPTGLIAERRSDRI